MSKKYFIYVFKMFKSYRFLMFLVQSLLNKQKIFRPYFINNKFTHSQFYSPAFNILNNAIYLNN